MRRVARWTTSRADRAGHRFSHRQGLLVLWEADSIAGAGVSTLPMFGGSARFEMRVVYFVLVVVALTGCGFVSNDPGGWGLVKWGMSRQQVCAAYPEARPLKQPLVPEDKTLVAPIWIHSHEIDGNHWDVWFFFTGGRDGKLAKVQLESSDAVPLASDAADRL